MYQSNTEIDESDNELNQNICNIGDYFETEHYTTLYNGISIESKVKV